MLGAGSRPQSKIPPGDCQRLDWTAKVLSIPIVQSVISWPILNLVRIFRETGGSIGVRGHRFSPRRYDAAA